ncbi:hypothetical protein HAX54_003199 [Datura stramonium]|uniref:Uncharacterized protein n=1 Tax=Datura stramonium TaxID=4076 RepID=A0ABS8T5N8_DATST|nr:hypothetical protein [Datura stramonium]
MGSGGFTRENEWRRRDRRLLLLAETMVVMGSAGEDWLRLFNEEEKMGERERGCSVHGGPGWSTGRDGEGAAAAVVGTKQWHNGEDGGRRRVEGWRCSMRRETKGKMRGEGKENIRAAVLGFSVKEGEVRLVFQVKEGEDERPRGREEASAMLVERNEKNGN